MREAAIAGPSGRADSLGDVEGHAIVVGSRLPAHSECRAAHDRSSAFPYSLSATRPAPQASGLKPQAFSANAFTLIELLTVMAIITLLIGILTPALSSARIKAQTTAVRAQLNAMDVGLESFHGDEGKYPPSNGNFYAKDPAAPVAGELTDQWEVAAGSNDNLVQGANLLVDALVGRDLLGYDPHAGTILAAGDPNSRWNATRDRRSPYIPVDGVDLTSADKAPEDGFGRIPDGADNPNGDPQMTIDGLLCRVFRDKFGWPILYYRASPTARQSSPIIQTGTNPQVDYYGDGVYDGDDNASYTSYEDCQAGVMPATGAHRICDADKPLPTGNYAGQPSLQTKHRFAEFIRSIRGTTYDTMVVPPSQPNVIWPRPVKADRFILLSAGKDGIYGTLDDVANFQALSIER